MKTLPLFLLLLASLPVFPSQGEEKHEATQSQILNTAETYRFFTPRSDDLELEDYRYAAVPMYMDSFVFPYNQPLTYNAVIDAIEFAIDPDLGSTVDTDSLYARVTIQTGTSGQTTEFFLPAEVGPVVVIPAEDGGGWQPDLQGRVIKVDLSGYSEMSRYLPQGKKLNVDLFHKDPSTGATIKYDGFYGWYTSGYREETLHHVTGRTATDPPTQVQFFEPSDSDLSVNDYSSNGDEWSQDSLAWIGYGPEGENAIIDSIELIIDKNQSSITQDKLYATIYFDHADWEKYHYKVVVPITISDDIVIGNGQTANILKADLTHLSDSERYIIDSFYVRIAFPFSTKILWSATSPLHRVTGSTFQGEPVPKPQFYVPQINDLFLFDFDFSYLICHSTSIYSPILNTRAKIDQLNFTAGIDEPNEPLFAQIDFYANSTKTSTIYVLVSNVSPPIAIRNEFVNVVNIDLTGVVESDRLVANGRIVIHLLELDNQTGLLRTLPFKTLEYSAGFPTYSKIPMIQITGSTL